MNEEILKQKLLEIEEKNYELEAEGDYYKLALEMMKHIGSLDAELRDNLIYGTMFKWITNDKFNFEQLMEVLAIILDDKHLFYELYEQNADAVYTRTFSVLILALIIYKHREQNFLSEKALYEVKNRLLEYMNNEKDVRGFVEGRGWAHSAAHTADAVDEIVRCSCFNKEDLMDVLAAIKAKVCIGYYVYIDEENERLITAVEGILGRGMLSNEEILCWLQEFTEERPFSDKIIKYHLKVNVKDFLRSLYFRLLDKQEWEVVIKGIQELLNKLK
ncbi:DUF2785 domain-containing protein [Clostridium oryzae]|uniref:DUF2785 domain-containing protein n=1 Tax=Clostridium oryzae TaxID=1450648 RepID=A0A1V4I9N4_9CLOT|nr:DUF2785 domain-containing protein [Clostridium oryzae]OPJ56633.1 hypothetical protein CLORY_42360 [Clostridium oryzae]